MKKRTMLGTLLAAMMMCASLSFAVEGIAVKGNKSSKVYHKPACKHYTAKGTTEAFKTEADAVSAGYTACKQCGKNKASDKAPSK